MFFDFTVNWNYEWNKREKFEGEVMFPFVPTDFEPVENSRLWLADEHVLNMTKNFSRTTLLFGTCVKGVKIAKTSEIKMSKLRMCSCGTLC